MKKPHLKQYYDRLCQTYLYSHKAVGWESEWSQRIRFEIFLLIGNIEDSHILDVGCGLGDFLGFLNQENIPIRYTGVDLSPSMIHFAQKRFPADRFIMDDFEKLAPTHEITPPFDYVFASGTFNLKVEKQSQYIEHAICTLFSLARKGIAFNLLSAYGPSRKKNPKIFYYYDPNAILRYCFTLTPYVELKHHYLPHDFSIMMYK